MPEYLAPGVFIEETSYRSKVIEGVSTTTTGFIGPTRYGPTTLEPDVVTSLAEFERVYGDGQPLDFGGVGGMDNYTWHAARAFFMEGGKRLFVTRVFRPLDTEQGETWAGKEGRGTWARRGLTFRARHPGAYGNFTLRLTLTAGRNVLGAVPDEHGVLQPTLGTLREHDVVWVRRDAPSSPESADLYLAERGPDATWKFVGGAGSAIVSPEVELPLSEIHADPEPGRGGSVRVVTLTVEVRTSAGEVIDTWRDLPLDPAHRSAGRPDSIFAAFDSAEDNPAPITVTTEGAASGLRVLEALLDGDASSPSGDALEKGLTLPLVVLRDGNDGQRPRASEYEGKDDPAQLHKTGLKQLEAIEDVSIVAAPGSTWDYENNRNEANGIIALLLNHAERMRYRIAVLDSAQGQPIADVRKMRAKLNSKHGALYYPWVKVLDPITGQTTLLPPSGFVAGIYARNDIQRAVYKAPANEVVTLALGFERLLTTAQQELLNPEGINCFRSFAGRGMLLWGARTVSADPEWKYVNLRRYFAYLERSIERGTQWAVFEPNGERLWANVRRSVEDFLLNEWQTGALLGDKPDKAFFVRCDRTTMNQNDLDNGRLVCLIGVAPLTPAEFVIFRIGQWTSDRKA